MQQVEIGLTGHWNLGEKNRDTESPGIAVIMASIQITSEYTDYNK